MDAHISIISHPNPHIKSLSASRSEMKCCSISHRSSSSGKVTLGGCCSDQFGAAGICSSHISSQHLIQDDVSQIVPDSLRGLKRRNKHVDPCSSMDLLVGRKMLRWHPIIYIWLTTLAHKRPKVFKMQQQLQSYMEQILQTIQRKNKKSCQTNVSKTRSPNKKLFNNHSLCNPIWHWKISHF